MHSVCMFQPRAGFIPQGTPANVNQPAEPASVYNVYKPGSQPPVHAYNHPPPTTHPTAQPSSHPASQPAIYLCIRLGSFLPSSPEEISHSPCLSGWTLCLGSAPAPVSGGWNRTKGKEDKCNSEKRKEGRRQKRVRMHRAAAFPGWLAIILRCPCVRGPGSSVSRAGDQSLHAILPHQGGRAGGAEWRHARASGRSMMGGGDVEILLG